MTASADQVIRYAEGGLGMQLAPWQEQAIRQALQPLPPLAVPRRAFKRLGPLDVARLFRIPYRLLEPSGSPKPLIHNGKKAK